MAHENINTVEQVITFPQVKGGYPHVYSVQALMCGCGMLLCVFRVIGWFLSGPSLESSC